MKNKTKLTIFMVAMLAGLHGLAAQSPANAAVGWSNCDFRPFMIYDKYHIAMMGDSNGALWMVPPKEDAFDITKRWATYLDPKPRYDADWKVLHTAIPGMESWVLLKLFKSCMTDPTISEKFKAHFPMRIWLQVGGNDLLQSGDFGLLRINNEYLPHLAHYRLNGILNNISEIVHIANSSGRTVLLVSYFPLPTFNAMGGVPPSVLKPYTMLCSAEGMRPDSNHIPDSWDMYKDSLTKPGNYSILCNPLISQIVGEVYNLIVDANIPFLSDIFSGEALKWKLRDIDTAYGRMFGLDTSLTGFIKNPGQALQRKWDKVRGHKPPRAKLGIAEAWDWITHQPRGIVGWELVNVLPNRKLANSVMVHRLGQRYAELWAAQNTQIAGVRGTVSFLNIAPEFYDYTS